MTLIIKTLYDNNLSVDISNITTILDLKKEIYKLNENYDVCNQKLIFYGNFLDNLKKLIDYKITNKSYIILIIDEPDNKLNDEQDNKLNDEPDNKLNDELNNEPDNKLNDEPNDELDDELDNEPNESMVRALSCVGFNKEHIIQILKNTNNNITLATEKLGTEYKTDIMDEIKRENNHRNIQQFTSNHLLSNQFNANPQLLNNLIQSLDANYDEQHYVNNNLNDVSSVELTEEENLDIESLIDLGFSKTEATQAYIVCDKDKEKAANYLFNL